jgi:hypothetical protein
MSKKYFAYRIAFFFFLLTSFSLSASSLKSDRIIPRDQEKVFFILFGPPASGKMTIGQELAQRTDLKLFHNHLVIEPLLTIFDFKEPCFRNLVQSFRSQIFEEAARNSMKGIIFTFVWNFNNEQSKDSMDSWSKFFKDVGGKVYVVELICGLDERLQRNRTENRCLHKPSKRDLEKSEAILLENERNWKMQSDEDFYYGDKFLKIDNTDKSPSEIVDLIIRYFDI